jgi:hypothetical protein
MVLEIPCHPGQRVVHRVPSVRMSPVEWQTRHEALSIRPFTRPEKDPAEAALAQFEQPLDAPDDCLGGSPAACWPLSRGYGCSTL